MIAHVGLDGFEDRYPNELSGGMRKRACSRAHAALRRRNARCSTSRSRRSTPSSSSRCTTLLLQLAAETEQTVVLVTHDLMEAVTLADRVLVCTRRPATLALEQRIELAAAARRPQRALHQRVQGTLRRAVGAPARSNTTRSGYDRSPIADRCRLAAARQSVHAGQRARQRHRWSAVRSCSASVLLLHGRARPADWSTTSSSPTRSTSATRLYRLDHPTARSSRTSGATVYATGDGLRHRLGRRARFSVSGSASRRFASRLLNPVSERPSTRCQRSRWRRCSCCGSGSASSRRSRSPPCWCCSSCSSTPLPACARSTRT